MRQTDCVGPRRGGCRFRKGIPAHRTGSWRVDRGNPKCHPGEIDGRRRYSGNDTLILLAFERTELMKKSSIQFAVHLDDQNVPDKIEWDATDKPEAGLSETKAIAISLWDHQQKNTMRIDLWTKDMPVDEMKRFYIDCVGGLSQSVLSATGDEFMANEMSALCERLARHVQNPSH
jgi:gliding motility-associated protein GldC